jgi:hypothetical protein
MLYFLPPKLKHECSIDQRWTKINTKKGLKRIVGSGAESRAVYPDKQLGFPGT